MKVEIIAEEMWKEKPVIVFRGQTDLSSVEAAVLKTSESTICPNSNHINVVPGHFFHAFFKAEREGGTCICSSW